MSRVSILSPNPVQIPGIQESLAAPGIAVSPPVSQGARDGEQLFRALGVTGNTAGELGYYQREQQKHIDAAAEKAEVFDRANATTTAATKLPLYGEQIDQGKISPSGTDDGLASQVDQLVGQDTPGMSPAAADEYRRHMAPALMRLLVARRDQIANVARADNLASLPALAANLSDPAEINGVIDKAQAVYPEVPRSKLVETILIPAAEHAAAAGDTEKMNANLSAMGDLFPVEQDRIRGAYAGVVRQQAADASKAVASATFDLADTGAPFETIQNYINSHRDNPLTTEQADELQHRFLTRAQQQTEDDLRTRILTNTITVGELDDQVKKAAGFGRTDPRFIDPQTGQTLLDSAQRRDKVDLAKFQVGAVLSGGAGDLTESQHGEAFVKMAGPEGAGFIDPANRIVDAGSLTQGILRARIMPDQLKATILSNLHSPAVADQTNAAAVIGAIGNSSPRLFAKLIDGVSAPDRAMIDAAAQQYQRGQFRTPDTAASALDSIRTAGQGAQDIPRPSPEVVADINQSKKIDPESTLTAQATTAIRNVRETFPYTKDSFLGFDWLNPDPTLQPADSNIQRRVQNWYADRYTQLRTNLPADEARAGAAKYAEAQIKNNVDFVRWNNRVAPVAIDSGQGLRLPESLRWGQGFEEQAQRDLKAAGFKAEDVSTLRPYTDIHAAPGVDPTKQMGWQFITHEGTPLADDKGRLVLFRPDDAAAVANAKYRLELDKREADFNAWQAAPRVNPDTGINVPEAPLNWRWQNPPAGVDVSALRLTTNPTPARRK